MVQHFTTLFRYIEPFRRNHQCDRQTEPDRRTSRTASVRLTTSAKNRHVSVDGRNGIALVSAMSNAFNCTCTLFTRSPELTVALLVRRRRSRAARRLAGRQSISLLSAPSGRRAFHCLILIQYRLFILAELPQRQRRRCQTNVAA